MRLVLSEHKSSEPEMPSPAHTLVEVSALSSPSFKRKRGTCDDSDISGPQRAAKRVRDASPQPALRQPTTEQAAIAILEDLWERTATALAAFSWPGPVAFVDGWIEAGPLRDAVEEHEKQFALLMQEAQGVLCGRFGREAREKRASVCELISGQTKQLYDWIDEAREGARRRLPTPSPPTSSTPTLSQPPSESLRGRSLILSATPSRGTSQADPQTVSHSSPLSASESGLKGHGRRPVGRRGRWH
ncbi:hypothetical protein EXIGLDRAFT_475323 [Exidia glandulosa HHB12029]|uniref:Uncharacterized protein n=1 Tax=Exidia glandulosa HHB12029 TaxID=1314781 RepID=A0A166NLI1_EXIGL|nr:hypothetical protein EXIGLDRAFT_475323 [Exidia glandulosa HHB12029]